MWFYDFIDILLNLKSFYPQNEITGKVNESILRARKCTLRYVHTHIKVWIVQKYKKSAIVQK